MTTVGLSGFEVWSVATLMSADKRAWVQISASVKGINKVVWHEYNSSVLANTAMLSQHCCWEVGNLTQRVSIATFRSESQRKFRLKGNSGKKTGFDRKRLFPIDRKVSEIDRRKKMIFLLMTRKFASAPDRQLTSKLFKRRRRRQQTLTMATTTTATMSTEWLDLHDRHLAAENTGCLKTVGMSSIFEYDK